MRWTIRAYKVAAWMLVRDLMTDRGLSEQWLREQMDGEQATFDAFLKSAPRHRVGEYCELILEAEKMPPGPGAEPFDAGYVDLFQDEQYREVTDLPGPVVAEGGVAEGGVAAETAKPRLMLLDLAFEGVWEDVRAKRCSAEEARATLLRYLERLPPQTG